MSARSNQAALIIVVTALIVGCDNGLATVGGKVTVDGVPVVGGPLMYGTVTFSREDGGGAPAVGIIDASGNYALKTGARDEVAPGFYLVGIAVKKITLPTNPNDMPQPTLISPRKYASVTESGLRKEVQPGSNSFDFELESERTN